MSRAKIIQIGETSIIVNVCIATPSDLCGLLFANAKRKAKQLSEKGSTKYIVL